MNKRRKLFLASVAALIALPGCASSSANWFGSRQSASKPAFANQSSASKLSTGTNSANAMGNANSAYGSPASSSAGTQPSPFNTASSGNAVTNAFRNASAAVGSALTIHPKVTPPNDAISLSSKTGKLGPEVYIEAARLAESRGNLDGAVQQYRRAIEAAPKNTLTLLSLARLYDRQENIDEAVKLYQRAIQIDDRNVTAHNDLGLCLARHGNLELSLAELAKAVSLQPDKQLYRNNLATVLAQAGRYDEALSQLTTAHGPAVAHYNLGHLLKQQGKLPLAAEHFRQAVELDPQLAPAQKMLRRLEATFASQGTAASVNPADRPYHAGDDSVNAGDALPYSPPAQPATPAQPQVAGGEWSPPTETTAPRSFEPLHTNDTTPPTSEPPSNVERVPSEPLKSELTQNDTSKSDTPKASAPPAAAPESKLQPLPPAPGAPVPSRRTPELRYPNTGFSLPSIEGPTPPVPDDYRAAPAAPSR